MKEYMQFFTPDLHLHSTCSDGSDTPEELLGKVRAAGRDLFALTDHNAVEGCRRIITCRKTDDPAFLCGVEFNCRDALDRYHLLGYGYDPENAFINEIVKRSHRIRMQKMQERFAFLEEKYRFVFSEQDKEDLAHLSNPGRPHFARLMVQYGYVKDTAAAHDILKEYQAPELYLTPQEAASAIRRAGGVPVLAHGILGDGSQSLSYAEIRKRVEYLLPFGLKGLECYHSGFSREQRDIMLSLAKQYNLLVTAGSDYHGTVKKVRIGEIGEIDLNLLLPFYREMESRIFQ